MQSATEGTLSDVSATSASVASGPEKEVVLGEGGASDKKNVASSNGIDETPDTVSEPSLRTNGIHNHDDVSKMFSNWRKLLFTTNYMNVNDLLNQLGNTGRPLSSRSISEANQGHFL